MSADREISVDYLARVEGEGAMYLRLRGEEVADLRFEIFEPPRFFEAFLRGRHFSEAPDLTSRICGICPIAYQVSACNAMENAAGAKPDQTLLDLRRLVYCGEWIASHCLHVYLLHVPDFLGYSGVAELARHYPEEVRRGLDLKRTGNRVMAALGGREIHPINLRVGGFHKTPPRSDLDALVPELEQALTTAQETVRWVSSFSFPHFQRDYEFVALRHPDRYAIESGTVVSNRGLEVAVEQWAEHFEERQVPWSNALHSRLRSRGAYHVGPMARYNLNFEQLTPLARRAAEQAGLGVSCTNPFQSIVVRAVEMVLAVEEALRLIDSYQPPPSPQVAVDPRSRTGHGASEAPRGLLYHRYDVDAEGLITEAHLVPPTAQNQLSIEDDLRALVPGHAHLPDEALRWRLEQAIRNYDPCISCATHFLDLTVERET